ncbi:hypothetical protein lbkm_3615 [Lachnospiraceae bacterium KM106-2]|nr:hypothetical protein lbkm_3615 [Lachnospiraceae bacterium KM106-2]
MFTSVDYKELQERYHKKEGIGAIGIYLLAMLLAALQGYCYTTNLKASILDYLQTVFDVLDIFILLLLVKVAKQKLNTIGFTKQSFLKSAILGMIESILLIGFVTFHSVLSLNKSIHVQLTSVTLVLLFIIGPIAEEMMFRGYIETRLSGLVKNPLLCSCITGAMFVSIHYPVNWVVLGEVSFLILPTFHVICLLLLHFLCDLIYRKTNCLWGSIILHILYDIGTAVIIVA